MTRALILTGLSLAMTWGAPRELHATDFEAPGSSIASRALLALGAPPNPVPPEGVLKAAPNYNIHFQSTVIDQGHSRFRAAYSGPNSLQGAEDQLGANGANLGGGKAGDKGFNGDFLRVFNWEQPGLAGSVGVENLPGL